MLTGEVRSQVDAIWNAFWTGGISNPMEVMEQITYLLFIRRLDDAHTLEESRALILKKPIANRIFPEGKDPKNRPYDDLRWSRFKNFAAAEMFSVVGEHVFPFLRALGGDGSTYAHHMKDARFTIPTPSLLAKVVDMLDQVPLEDRDTKGDVYEYMLGKIASAGQNGQFRTPRHIIRLMVEMTAPMPKDVICDPASGTCGFLVAAAEYLREAHPTLFQDDLAREHFNRGMFHGYDFDTTMLRIGSMNMALHGVENPDIRYKDSLAQDHAGDEEVYSLILANPPFAGSLDYENTAKDLLSVIRTKKTELLFVALFLRLLKAGGRAAVVVPDGVLFGSTKAHRELRKKLVEEQKLEAVISLPAGVFKPYANVSTAILLFTKTNSGGTDSVWFYDMEADGWSLDDKRQPLLSVEKLGATPTKALSPAEHEKNNLPDVLSRWRNRAGSERERSRSNQSFVVQKDEIAAQNYDLTIAKYKAAESATVSHQAPTALLNHLTRLGSTLVTTQDELSELVAATERTAASGEQWAARELGEFIQTVTNGLTRRRSQGDEGRDIVLRLKDIRAGWIEFSDPNRITLTENEAAKYSVSAGDLLFIRVNGNPDYVGRCAVFKRHGEPVFFNDHIMRVRLDAARMNPDYLALMLNSSIGAREIARHRKTSAGQHTISQDGLSRIRLPVPPLDIQNQLAEILDNIRVQQNLFAASVENLNALFSSLQERFFGVSPP